jgi:hypothetical protein
MAADDNQQDRLKDEQPPHGLLSSAAPDGTVDYELTAKDAGWRTPTFLVSRANIVYFDSPRRKNRPRP